MDVYLTPNSVILATWKDTDDIAFIAKCLHNHNLIRKCFLSTPHKVYSQSHSVVSDDVDPKYGLHGYDVHIHLHTFGLSLWDQKFSCVYSKDSTKDDYIEFELAQKNCQYLKYFQLRWQTEVFKGVIEKTLLVDMTMTDCNKGIFWSWSSPLVGKKFTSEFASIENGQLDNYKLEYSDNIGCLQICISSGKAENKLNSFYLYLKKEAINTWFGKQH